MLEENLGSLATEAQDPKYANIDTMSVADLARTMNEADATVPTAVAAALPTIVPAIEATSARMQAEGARLIYVGAGTPGRLAIVDASECVPTFNTWPGQVQAVMAGGADAIVTPKEGAEDDAEAGAAAIAALGITPNDTVLGIASSGRTPYVLGAIEQARTLGALTVGLSCNADTALSAAAEHGIEVLVGPEVLTGSTRLKAGTAQKLVLNMFSTIVMVQLGKTYGSLMVDLRATNHKLRERAIRMVMQITGAGRDVSERALVDADGRVKPAVVMIKRDLEHAAALAALDEANGRLRVALEEAS